MMKTLAALVMMSAAAFAQDRAPQDPPAPRRPDDPAVPPRAQDPNRRQDPPGPRPPQPPAPPEGRRDPFQGPQDGRPGQPGQPRPGAERRGPPPFNPDEVRAWLKDNEPETFRRMMEAQEGGRPEESMRMLAEAASRLREFSELRQRDPKGFEKMQEMRRLEHESMEQADQARRAPPEGREAAEKRLRETLGRLFDAREEARGRELVELKRRIEAIEKSLTERKAGRDRIIEKRRRELMGEKSEDDW